MTIGQDTRVNTTTTSDQLVPATTALADGGWVVAWESYDQDGDSAGVYQQRFAADGNAIGSETHVSTTTTGRQYDASITALDGGGWVVVWQSGSGASLYMQRYDAQGEAEGEETKVNAITTGFTLHPTVAALADGGFVVSWDRLLNDVMYRRFDAHGNASEDESLVNTYTTSAQSDPSISRLADGGWITTWTSVGQDGDGAGIYQQRYKANGDTDGGETQVNTYTTSAQSTSAVTALNDGGWVVSWSSSAQDAGRDGIYMQRYAADGATVGGEKRINGNMTATQHASSITALTGGGWVAAWMEFDEDANKWRCYQRAFDADGKVILKEMQLGVSSHGEEAPAVSGLADGGWIASWGDYDPSTDEYDVRQLRFEADGQFYGANDAPIGRDKTVRIDENYSYAFAADDFGFKDTAGEHDHFAAIVVTAAPKTGRLTLDGTIVQTGDRIERADLGDLVYSPPKHADGDGLAAFKFKVVDDGGTEAGGLDTAKAANTITFNVTPAIEGTDAAETLKGTSKHDVLDGLQGDDRLIGRNGSDIFVFGKGYDHDTIGDFDATSANHDVIDLRKLASVSDFRDLQAHHLSEHDSDVWIDGGHGDVLVLKGVDMHDLDRSDFLL